MKKFHLKTKKAKILTASAVIVVIACVCAGLSFAGNRNTSERKTVPTTKNNITTTVHTGETTTASAVETTKADDTTKKEETTKSTTEKSTTTKNQSSYSGGSKNNSQKQTTKKSTTTTKKETTTKAKSYAMSASEIRNYAINEIKKIDGTIYTSEFNKDNSGWYTPLIIEPGDSEEEIKEGIRDSVNFVYDSYTNGYNVYVENTTYWHATESYDGECKEYNSPCLKVYFLYGHIYSGPPEI